MQEDMQKCEVGAGSDETVKKQYLQYTVTKLGDLFFRII